MVVIQPSSGKVLVVNNTERGTWFLPRGRKDIGETLEQCALREAYEEVRYFRFVPIRTFCSKGGGVPCAAAHEAGVGAWLHACAHARPLAPLPFCPPPLFFPLTGEGTTTTTKQV
jgi:hypothetical protein